MQSKLKLDHQTRAVAMATGGAAVAAVVAMFVPTGIWETLTGATGVSEMIPATGAPLGDKARALISFTFGALTFAVLTVMFLRRLAPVRHSAVSQTKTAWIEPEPVESLFDEDEDEGESGSLFARVRSRIAAFVEARRGVSDITDLEDLPKLRSGDAHPDAPPRRPFSANRDIAEAEAIEMSTETVIEQVEVDAGWTESAQTEIEQAVVTAEVETMFEEAEDFEAEAADPAATVAPVAAETPVQAPVSEIASLDDMVSRFESALAERDAQLSHIESIASELQSSNVQPIRSDMEIPPIAEPIQVEQAALRSVQVAEFPGDAPQKPESEELDAALRSALETLHRMNARTR